MKGFQIRNAVLTIGGIVIINVVGPMLHGLAKPIVLFSLAAFFLGALFIHSWLSNRALRRREWS